MRRDERGHWYLLTGLVIGLILGLVYAWVIQPVEYVDTSPDSLRADFKDQYRALIAAAYVSNGDLVRALARLQLLKDEDTFRALSEQAQRTLAQDSASREAQALGLLAIAVGQGMGSTPANPTVAAAAETANLLQNSPTATTAPPDTPTPPPSATVPPTATPEPPTATLTPASETPTATLAGLPRPTDTLAPTFTPSPTPGGPFVLTSRQAICEQKLTQPLIMIEAVNSAGQPVAGVLVIVTISSGGEMRFFTGLKPEKGPGYADFIPAPGVIYTLRLGEAGELVTDLTALECKDASGSTFWGAWLLKFTQR